MTCNIFHACILFPDFINDDDIEYLLITWSE